LDVVRWRPGGAQDFPSDFDPADREIIARVRPFTMTSPERIFALIRGTEYVMRAKIPGAIVECGVWRGGSMMAAALTLLRLGAPRDLYLYDTFEGMTAPTGVDVDLHGEPAATNLSRQVRAPDVSNAWAYAPLQAVRDALKSTGYEADRIHFIKGPVEDTIPGTVPPQIALLRLDTDWYESTRHELEHLYPLLAPGGVLIIDDYGHYAGARKATDEFFQAQANAILLCRVDYTGRIAVKPC
jgi:hypothetical protein